MFVMWLAGVVGTSWRGEIHFCPWELLPAEEGECSPLKDCRERMGEKEESWGKVGSLSRAPETCREE